MHRHTPYYCEENVWWLASEPGRERAEVVVISNRARSVAMRAQRATPSGNVRWDYHLVLAERGELWDLDCTLGAPLACDAWLEASFDRSVPSSLAPRFRPIPSDTYVAHFASDRRHMRLAEGGWSQPPPSWPMIGGGAHELDRFLDLDDTTLGPWLSLEGLRAHWGAMP